MPVVLSAAQTFNIVGGLTVNSNVTGGFAITTTGGGTLTFGGTGASVIGDLQVTTGLVRIAAGSVNVSATQGNSKIDNNSTVEVDAGATLNITNGANAWFPVSDTSDTINTLTVAGGTVNINDNWGIEVPRQGNAILNINSGSMTVNDSGGVGLIIGDQGTAQTGTVNLNGGTLVVNRITANNGTDTFYFNGGTLKPVLAGTFFPSSGALAAYVRNGGAVVDTAGLDVTIGQALLHSAVGGDNAIDGGFMGEPIRLVDGGLQKRCFTYIDDGVDCLIKIIENRDGVCDGQIFNIGNPNNEATVKELAEKLKALFMAHPNAGHFKKYSEITEVYSKDFYGEGYQDIDRRVPSVKKARELMGWEPKVDLDTALRKTLEYYLDSAPLKS